MRTRVLLILAVPFVVTACAPRRIHEPPIIQQGDRIPSAAATVEAARAATEAELAAAAARQGELTAAALSNCAPEICAAITRGEVALGMDETQVLAATRTLDAAWTVRRTGAATVMVPRNMNSPPRDATGSLAMVQIHDNRVNTYSYLEAQGVRVVSSPADATTAGRANALAEMLIREGDDLAARGDLAAALDRYDRADVLRIGDPMLDYRIASVLDKQLRPIEALIRYQLFLHQLDLERIDAVGDAYAKIADAITQARQRIIVLERQVR